MWMIVAVATGNFLCSGVGPKGITNPSRPTEQVQHHSAPAPPTDLIDAFRQQEGRNA